MPFDIGIGLFLGTILANNSGLNPLLCLLVGVISSLLPDIDFLFSYFKTKSVPDTSHRDGLHYPLILVPTVLVAGWIFSPSVGLILATGVLIHFIHDSIGIGFGVKWLYPFVNKSYLFLFQIKTPANKNMPKKRIYSWDNEERKEMIKKYGYKDWIRYVYFRPNPWGIFEYSIFLLGLFYMATNI